MSFGLIAGIVALVWSYSCAWLVCVALVRRYRRKHAKTTTAPAGRWLVVRPCAGAEPELEASLLSVQSRADNLPIEVIMGVSEESDPARPIAERAAAALRDAGLDARVEVVPPAGPNRKASTVAGLVERHVTDHAGFINIDSNIDMTRMDLEALVAPLGAERVGASWQPPVEQLGPTLGDRASRAVLGGSFHAFALLLALDPASLVGKVFAIRKDALEAFGLEGLPDYLGEDVELSTRLRLSDFDVQPVITNAAARPARGRFADTVARQARWVTVIRAQRPALLLTYPLLFAPTPLILVLAALSWLYSPLLAFAGVLAATAARLLVSAGARWASGLRWNPFVGLVDGALADLVLWAALIRGLASRELSWRGNRLRIDRFGKLHAI
jgi:ceramide glucosyltransferase